MKDDGAEMRSWRARWEKEAICMIELKDGENGDRRELRRAKRHVEAGYVKEIEK